MKLRIEATGDRLGTRVFNADSGEDISRFVKSIQFRHSALELPTLVIEFTHGFFDLKAEAEAEVKS